MINPLSSIQDYELFVYTLGDRFSSVQRSTLTFVRVGASLARVAGELVFPHDVRLVVRERLVFSRLPGVIEWYGYEAWKGQERMFWYDPQPHPGESLLQSTYPHHKHVPPDMKHNRVPAPQMSFARPNLPLLIPEMEYIL
jgi:hypothetical protein